MRVIDLSHGISEEMTVFPGTEPPQIRQAAEIAADGFREKTFRMTTHTGTHMDAAAHVFPAGFTLSRYPMEQFFGTGAVVDATGVGPGGVITMREVEASPCAGEADFLLFRTGWDRFWGTAAYFRNYPVISGDVARYIAESGKKGAGFDTLGIDSAESADLALHRIVLEGNRCVIIENLRGLEALPSSGFFFSALPLPIPEADGAPVRAAAVIA